MTEPSSELVAAAARELTVLTKELGSSFSPAWAPLIGIVGDQFSYWRIIRQLNFLIKVKAQFARRGLTGPTREIAPSFLVPLIEHAVTETDNDLQEVWTRLLTNAGDNGIDVDMRVAFVSMLSDMTHFDVQVLPTLSKSSGDGVADIVLDTCYLPERVEVVETTPPPPPRTLDKRVSICLENLHRLGCLTPAVTWAGINFGSVSLTNLGCAFIGACTK